MINSGIDEMVFRSLNLSPGPRRHFFRIFDEFSISKITIK